MTNRLSWRLADGSTGRCRKGCFVSRNIFGIGEYYSTSGALQIAGTKIIGKGSPLDEKKLPDGDNFEATPVAGGAYIAQARDRGELRCDVSLPRRGPF